MSTEQLIMIIIVLVIIVALIFMNGKPGAPSVTGTPVGYTGFTPVRMPAPSPYGVGSPGPTYTYGGGKVGGSVKALSPFRNPYSVAVLMVIAFAIWNFYAKKNKDGSNN